MSNEYFFFRGGYVEDPAGDRWWSADLLKKVEAERDKARAEVERRDREHEALVETAQKALAYVTAERDEALSRVAAEAGKDLAGWAADLDAAEAAHARVVAERDEARAEVERLRNDLHVYRAMALDIVLPESSLVRTTETAATAVRDLRRYQAFGPGWDGYAGRVFDAEVVAKAINLVEFLVASFQTARTEATEITPCPIADGRIDVEAACEGRRLVVTVAAENDDVGILYEDRGAPHEELVRWNSDDLGRWVRRLTGEDRGALVPIVHEQFDSATATGGDYEHSANATMRGVTLARSSP